MSHDIVPPRQREIYLNLGPPRVPVHPDRLQEAARKRLPATAYNYAAEGGGANETGEKNRAAFQQWSIVPRVLTDVSNRDTSVELFGRTLPHPIVLCPVGVLGLFHREADLAVAEAANRTGTLMVFSNQASHPMEAVAQRSGPRWFQLYWSKSNELVASLVQRAERVGCEAIVVTLDTPVLGWRTDNLELGYLPFMYGEGIAQYVSDPVFENLVKDPPADAPQPKPGLSLQALKVLWGLKRNQVSIEQVRTFLRIYSRATLTWDDLKFLREKTKLPIVLKGVLHPEDARKARDHGVNGLWISNHGGRQLDGCISTLEALVHMETDLPVILDSGIRTGADVFKALALGATAVGLGRPYVWGLGIAGAEGVREVIDNLLADFQIAMSLAGCRAIGDITRDRLAPASR